MSLNQVVVRFSNGSVLKGKTNDFSPNKRAFHVSKLDGETVEVDVEQLKAIFFVKDYEGDKHHINNYNDIISGGGKIVKVTFFDGETITGFTQSYSPERQGFFMTPAENSGNNDRIFVVKSSASKIQFRNELSEKDQSANIS